jgi:C4-dicarboxylate transporter DctM subunit
MDQPIVMFSLFLIFFILLLLGAPISIALGAAGTFFLIKYSLGFEILTPNFCGGIAKFPLLAVPFFILAGNIFREVGIAERIVRLVRLLTGSMYGGFAVAVVMVGAFWGAVSGSGPATTAALGMIFIPEMVKAGYPAGFSSALVASSAGLSIIIPPSVALILYGSITTDSISTLFIAGFIPGIITAFFIAAGAWIYSRYYGYRSESKFLWKDVLESIIYAAWGLIAPIVILGGIYGGIFSPTEAAVIGVFYGLFVGLFVYRSLNIKKIYNVLLESAISSAVVMIIVGFASVFTYVGLVMGVMEASAKFILSISDSPYMILLLVMFIVFIAGMLIDPVSIYYVFVPMFLPIIIHFKWSSIWFGILFTVNIAIAQISPPLALNLYVAAPIAGIRIEEVFKSSYLFVLMVALALFTLSLYPNLALVLPKILGYVK